MEFYNPIYGVFLSKLTTFFFHIENKTFSNEKRSFFKILL